jgi:tetratricopeptide (TPR) repeat protein
MGAETAATRVSAAGDRMLFHVALGQATRVLGDMSAAQRHLDGARTAGGGAEADLLAALLTRDEGNAQGAIDQLRAVSSQRETAVRAHLALARLFASRGEATESRAEIDAVLREQPNQEEAQGLAQAIAAAQPPFRGPNVAVMPVVQVTANAAAAVVADAGATPAVANATPPPPTTEPAADAGAAARAATHASSGGSGLAGRSYDSLVAEADRAQENGSRERARAAYTAAIAMRPDGSEAVAGLGWVELDGGSATLAINHFRRALSINPRYSEAYIGLGEAYTHMSDFASALRAYRQYLEVNPGGSRARIAQAQVEQLQRRLGGGSSSSGSNGSSSGSDPNHSAASGSGSSSSGSGTSGTSGSSDPAPSGGS